MTERESALATLSAIASSPDAVAESPAHLFAALDAVVAVYATTDAGGLRKPPAVWANVQAHAENRLRNLRTVSP